VIFGVILVFGEFCGKLEKTYEKRRRDYLCAKDKKQV
jgi:hypothetical protein